MVFSKHSETSLCCSLRYIGQRQRNIENCLVELRRSLSSLVWRHFNPSGWSSQPQVIGKDSNIGGGCRFFYSLLVRQHKLEFNANTPSVLLCIFTLHEDFGHHTLHRHQRHVFRYVTANASRYYIIFVTVYLNFYLFSQHHFPYLLRKLAASWLYSSNTLVLMTVTTVNEMSPLCLWLHLL